MDKNIPTDYSKKANWYQIPQITKKVDTFYIYATEYIMGSFEEGAPDYATLDNAEMLEGVKVEYRDHASAFAEATNVFLPYYRQSGLKFATGECDTGVIVAWNTEGPRNVETNAHNLVVLPKTRSINPLNWKLDETYAPASLNLGSVVLDEVTGEPEIGDVGADAQINLARGVVVTNAKVPPVPEDVAKASAAFFGADGRHAYDDMYYFNNIKENANKRVAAYLSK